jgi:hypothetical protein
MNDSTRTKKNGVLPFFKPLLIAALAIVTVFASRAQTVTTDKDDYSPGEYVIVTGSGWQPGETVDLDFHETPQVCTNDHHVRNTVADANGDIVYNQFLINDKHMGLTFVLTATGLSSGLTAQTTFTDAAYQFGANGLPPSTSVTVNWTISGTGGGNGTFTSNPFTPPALSTQPNINNKTITVNWFNYSPLSSINYQILNYGIRVGASSNPTTTTTSNEFNLAGNNAASATLFTANYGALVVNPVTGTYGGVVNLTATLYSNYNASPKTTIANKLISFKIGTDVVGSASTDGNGVATLLNVNLSTRAAGGDYTITAEFSGITNEFLPIDGEAKLTINKANPIISVTGYTGFYDALPHSATGTAKGVFNEDLAGLDLGASFTNVPGGTANWVFTDVTGNYNNASGTTAIVINKANALVTVTGYSGVYDAAAHGASGTVVGVAGDPAAAGSSLDLGASFTNVPGGTASWTFTGGTNYEDESGEVEIEIAKANALVTVTGYSGVYDALPHGASGTATGVNNVDLSAGLDLGASFTDVPGGTANWTFDGGINYNDQSGSVAIVINKADAVVSVTGYTGTYDALPHGASGTATGVNNVDLSAGLDLGASFTDVPGGTANWTFDGGINYNDQSGSVAIVINKADAVVTVSGYTGTYDAQPHGATGTATGVNNVDLSAGLDIGANFTDVPGGTANWTFDGGINYNDQSGSVAIVINKADAVVSVTGYTGTYDALPHGASGTATGVNNVDLSAGLDLGASFTDVPGGTANWTFDGGINYNDQSGSVAIVINKADAVVSVTGYTGTYDALPHGASGTATGVNSVDLSAGLDLGASFTDVPGGTANWTFDGGINYNDQSGSVAIVINKADAVVTVSGYTGTYDAQPHGATGTATGVNNVDLSAGLDLGLSFTDVPGGTVNWTFDGGINYNDQSGSVAIVINKADAVVTVSGYSGTYDAQPHGATGTATGVNNVDLSAGLDLGASFTDVPGGTANWTFDGGINYNDQSGSVAIVINKADAVVTVSGYTGTYDAQPHGATGTATGVNNVDLSAGLDLGASFTDVPGGTANWTFDGGINYNDQSGSVAIVINKADAVVTVSGYTGTYDAQPHGATGTATGVNNVDLSAGLDLGASFTDVPGGTANWTFDGGINYNDQSGSVAIVINKAALTITANDASKYTGQANPAFSVSYSGFVGGETESELGGTLTFTTPADQGSCAGEYAIIPSGLTSDNYALTFVPGTLTINSISIDASASSTPVQINTSATLSATVTPNVAGVSVTFTLTNDANAVVFSQTVLTNASGVATTTVPSSVIGSNPTVYKVDATAGSDCSNSVAYLPVFDPNANFVTGGGWITSPYVANAEYMQVEGRANFGFVSRYKKGTNNVDGNTEFQFQAGNLNFKSTMHESGSLVISGNRATYRGTGTINGMTGYKFVVVAIDGHLNGGTNPDRFRIKITRTADDVVVYDNQFGSDENTADATILGNNGTGGGSIVIHQVKTSSGGKKREAATEAEIVTEPTVAMETMSIDVYPNPMRGNVIVRFDNPDRAPVQLSLMDMSGRQVQVQVTETTEGYVLYTQDLTNGFYFLRLRVGNRMEGIKLLKQD